MGLFRRTEDRTSRNRDRSKCKERAIEAEKKRKIRKKKKRATCIGYLLILIGIAIPLYAFTNMTVNEILAKQRYDEYIHTTSVNVPGEREREEAYNEKVRNSSLKNDVVSAVDPFAVKEYRGDYTNLVVNKNKIFAYLEIPSVGIKRPIYLDANEKNLLRGTCHLDQTALPIGGKGNRSVIAGHRGYYKDTMFYNIGEVKKGDHVYITRGNRRLVYTVDNLEVIQPSQWEKLLPKEDEDLLTLVTCEPKRPPRPYRLLVNCKREEPKKTKLPTANDSNRRKKVEQGITIEKESVKVQRNKFLIYIITILGYIAFVWVFIRFVDVLAKEV